MKRILLLSITFFSLQLINAQCSPDPLYSDSAWGIWPDPVTNFIGGDIGINYSQSVDFKVPFDAGLIDPAYTGQYIDSIVLNNVTNLPPGLIFSCNNSSCTWHADSAGCALINGTPTTNGAYQISLDVTAWTTVFTLAFPVDYPYDGYIINIGPVGISTLTMTNKTLSLEQAIPNPANQNTRIQFISGSEDRIEYNMINLLGEVVDYSIINSKRGVNDILVNTTNLENGVYLYSISNGLMKQTKRLIVNH